ncbi:MAG: SDR family oxidoreductase [Beijerinckiaceae bacterium]
MSGISGKTIVVTGASQGLGESIARLASLAGARVVLAARSRSSIERLAAELTAQGGKAIAVPTDVSNYAENEALVRAAESQFGPVDVWIANAGVIEPMQRVAESDPEAWSKLIDINLKGVYYGTRAVLPGMLARGRGTILTIGSGAAHNPLEAWSAYCSSKAAALMLTKSVHHETADKGIVNINFSPGIIATDMQKRIRASGINPVSQIPAENLGDPEIPARIAIWLCGPAGKDYAGQDVRAGDAELRKKAGIE